MTPNNLSRFLDGNGPVVRARLAKVQGSSPREVGAEMFVGKTDMIGSIGGGRLEYMAVEAARKLLAAGDLASDLDVPLGPEIGQCCGGRVLVSLTRMSDADRIGAVQRAELEARARPHVYILGAGHIGRALAGQFQHLPFQTIVVDGREDELVLCDAAVEKRLSAVPESDITTAPPGSAFIVLTHDHALDFLLASAALQRDDAAYVGLIGSATKRMRFEKWLQQNDKAVSNDALVCPIGKSTSGDKRPEAIAVFVVAEVVDALSANQVMTGNSAEPRPAKEAVIPSLPRTISGRQE